MDYFAATLGSFDPQHDPQFAVKFALNSILMDERMDDLKSLLTDGHDIGGIEGDPGWIIERRDSGPSGSMPGYDDWPVGMNFRVRVDKNSFALAYPQQFLKTDEFHGYVRKGVATYLAQHVQKSPVATHIMSIVAT